MRLAQALLSVFVLKVVIGASTPSGVILTQVFTPDDVSTGCTSNFANRSKPCQYKAFRIPGLVNGGNGTLLAFAEGRKYGGGDFGPGGTGLGQHDLVMRRSTDSGATFGPLTTVIDAVGFWQDAELAPVKGNAVWDPTPVYDAQTNTLWVLFNGPGRLGADCARFLCSTWAAKSTDNGLTWHTQNVSSECQGGRGLRASNSPGNGHGIQLSTGELVVPMYGGEPAGASLCISPDHGLTWVASPGSVSSNADEIEVAELPASLGRTSLGEQGGPVLYMTIRNDDCDNGILCPGSEGTRQFSVSADLGRTWSKRLNVQVPDSGNKGSVLSDVRGGNLVLSTTASCVNRVNMTLFVSKENGAPGSFVHRLHVDQAGGYSTLGMTDEGAIALLYEQEWTLDPSSSGDPAGSHAVAGSGSILLARVDPKLIQMQGAIPCKDALCPTAHPPPPPDQVDPNVGYCRAPL